MAVTLNKVVPWGRSFDEYVAMFALSKEDLEKRILDCGSGPVSFNVVDPIYRFNSMELRNRINEAYDRIMEQMRENEYLTNFRKAQTRCCILQLYNRPIKLQAICSFSMGSIH